MGDRGDRALWTEAILCLDYPATAPGLPYRLLEGLEAGLGDVLLVKLLQRVQECVHLAHHDLRSLPALVLGDLAPRCCQNHDSSCDVDHGIWRGSEGLQLSQVVLQG